MHFKIYFLALLLLAVMSPPMQAQEAVDPSGTWRFRAETEGQAIDYTFALSLGEDGRVLGRIQRLDSTSWEIEEGKIEGNELSFMAHPEYRGRQWLAKFRGRLNGDEIEGEATVTEPSSGRTRSIPWAASRTVAMEDVMGSWSLKIPRRNGGSWDVNLSISRDGEQYKGIYSSRGEQHVVNGLGIENNQLTFSAVVTRAGRELTLIYKGRPYGAHIKNGTVDVNNGAFSTTFTGMLSAEE